MIPVEGTTQGLQAARVRFDLAQLLGPNSAHANQSIGFPAPAQFFQTRAFIGVSSDDDLAADLVGYPVLTAELDHRGRTRNAKTGFQGTGLVIDAGVNDSAVVATLVLGYAIFFLEKQKLEARKTPRDFEGDPESHHTAADNDYVVAEIGH